ncbi:MAG: teicoplanin resistance protein VanZ [Betaproteobacteria bacterium HGW-Betaproteobacteria-10]|nr:MAG: teicoplanin resistance protein VanZ [Betaproteobacteria bacterium HGW-Betaproteobacteria-10]
MNARGPILLARYLALAWCGLVVYASLHPFSGWRTTGISPLAFLDGGWPRYWTAFDLLANVAVYLPLGFFLTLALKGLPGRFSPLVLAVLLAAGVSFSMETLQNWLPSRVPSNLDLACNTLGGLLGAGLAQMLGPRVFARILTLEHRLIAPIPHAELGLTLLGLWLLVPLSPEILLFGAGDLRQLIGFSSDFPFVAESFVMIEATITAFNAIAVGLILRLLCARLWIAYLLVPLYLALGLAIRTLAAAILIGPGEALLWWTPGAQLGLLVAGLVLAISLALPATPRLMLIILALISGTVLVNLAPPNPYSMAALATWRQGHFLNFNGLTRWVATLWPFLTLPFLLLIGRRP